MRSASTIPSPFRNYLPEVPDIFSSGLRLKALEQISDVDVLNRFQDLPSWATE